MNENNKPHLVPIAIIAAGLLIASAIYFRGPAPTNQLAGVGNAGPNKALLAKLAPIQPADHLRGQGQITIIEYSDLECPFCQVFQRAMNRLVAKYDGQLAWVYRHFPLDSIHPKARSEAAASECVAELGGPAGNDKFWQYIDKIFAVTPANNGLDLALLPKLAAEVGIDQAQFESCLESGRHAATVDAQYQNGVEIGVDGTPFVIMLSQGSDTPFLPFREEAIPTDWPNTELATQIMTDLSSFYQEEIRTAQQ